ncbi:MAG: 4Fe-4S dicluster domain-containing protein [Clostridiales bacterium]|nr:4Fe-4S dicluster domain-containing protein [Clostridiales bacterium]
MSIFTKRGVRLPMMKEPAASRPIEEIETVGQVLLPLAVKGDPRRSCRPALVTYSSVIRGQVIGLPEEGEGTPVISSVTGVLAGTRTLTHPLYGEMVCAVLDCMVVDAAEPAPRPHMGEWKPEEILGAARTAGIVDELDGIPLHEKLRAWQNGGCNFLVADAAEQEPYASSAWAVLNESIEQVQEGVSLAVTAAGAAGGHIAVRLPAARRRRLARRLRHSQLFQVRSRYPARRYAHAAEDVAVCRIGVQACLALYRAVVYGEPQCDVVITVAGDAVATPQNIRVPFGTGVHQVLRACGLSVDPDYVVLGDAMTGVAIQDLEIPVLPGITCLLALTGRKTAVSRPCIGCGRCAQVCHAGLLPGEIAAQLENMHYERLSVLLPGECDGCGACSHVCPAGRDVAVRVMEAQDNAGTIFLNWGDDDDA